MLIAENTRYLVIPVSRSAPVTKLRLKDGEQLLIDLDAAVDFQAPESVMYYDLTPFMGKDVTVVHESGKSFGFSEKKPAPPHESVRPKLHFAAEYGWLNDPNGLIYYEGRWHLFFQHNPVGVRWGNMHWGHALSRDLVRWEESRDVLIPDEMGDMYSGSAIIDHDNLLGLNTPEHEALLLFYTAAGGNRELCRDAKYTQCLAYSTDGGKTFTKYAKNPIVPHIAGGNRDPKVMRDPVSGLYLMALYLDGDRYALLTSKNLIDWTEIQTLSLPGDNECPDIFRMNGRWVLGGAHDCYTVCDFDPARGFVNLSSTKKLGFGKCYAAQSFAEPDSRRIRISWNRLNIPSPNFNCAMGTPCELKLAGEELFIAPAAEFEAAYTLSETLEQLPALGVSRTVPGPCELILELSRMEEPLTLYLHGNKLVLDAAANTLSVGNAVMPLCAADGRVSVRIIDDYSGIEVFAGLTEHGARVYGVFDGTITSDTVTLMGEGSLDRLTIRKTKE